MRHKLLICTPTLTSGSWVVIENLLPFLERKFEINIVGLGEGRTYKDIPTTKIQYKSFETINPKFGSNIFYNAFYQLPLQFTIIYKLFKFRPNIILSNGFGPLLTILLFTKILNIKVAVYYGTHLGTWFDYPLVLPMLKILNNFVDIVFLNSSDSKEDASNFLDEKKLMIVDHSTPYTTFSDSTRNELRKKYNLQHSDFVFIHANRQVPSKNVHTLLKLLEKTIHIKNLKYYFAGEGTMLDQILELEKKHPDQVKYLGKIGVIDKTELREWLTIADLAWVNAETTYMALSGVEALAHGTPIIISNEIYHQTRLVPESLIPKNVGWVVKHDDIDTMAKLIEEIVVKRLTHNMRKAASEDAQEKFSTRNLENVANKLISIINN